MKIIVVAESASTPASSTSPAPDEQRVKRGAARRRWSWSHPAERTARRRRDAENTSKNTHLGRLKLRICALLLFFQPSLCSRSPPVKHSDTQRLGEEVGWETDHKRAAERPNYGSNDTRRKARPVRLPGAGCRAGWEVCCTPTSVRPGRNITWQAALPLGGQKQTPSLLSTWKLEAGNGSDPPCVQCACSPQLSSPSLLCRRPTTRLSSLWPTWGKLWPRDYRRRTCQCRVSMRGAQWAPCARLRGLQTQPRRDIRQTPAKSLKVQGPPQRRCRSGEAMWLRRTPSWTPSLGNSTVKVRSPFSYLLREHS